MKHVNTQRLLLVAWVVASVLLSDLASTQVWQAGGHATPQQWALHDQYEALGVHHHHGHADNGESETAPLSLATGSSELFWTVVLPGGTTDPGYLSRSLGDVDAGTYASLTTTQRMSIGDAVRPTSLYALLLDPPPRRSA